MPSFLVRTCALEVSCSETHQAHWPEMWLILPTNYIKEEVKLSQCHRCSVNTTSFSTNKQVSERISEFKTSLILPVDKPEIGEAAYQMRHSFVSFVSGNVSSSPSCCQEGKKFAFHRKSIMPLVISAVVTFNPQSKSAHNGRPRKARAGDKDCRKGSHAVALQSGPALHSNDTSNAIASVPSYLTVSGPIAKKFPQ